MGNVIQQLTVEGFKSIQKLEKLELRPLNVLIGANGAGKSNFIELFKTLRAIAEDNLRPYVEQKGGADGFFFLGPKYTPLIRIFVAFGNKEILFIFGPTADGNLQQGGLISPIPADQNKIQFDRLMSKWIVYHFHDTSALSPMRREQSIQDTAYLRPDASNIAAFLRAMRDQNPAEYALIRDTIRIVAPFFDDFLLKERIKGSEQLVALGWKQKASDFPFQAWHLSDGTLRFICLVTALLQPDPPPTIVIDEPELGLHPHALEVLAGLLKKTSLRAQVIVSTQSATLLSQFEPEDIITVSRKDGASTFARLDRQALVGWMEDYTLGELWQKNVVEAGATND